MVNTLYAFAQKPSIDSSVYRKWPSVANPGISDNGKYVYYDIKVGTVYGNDVKTFIQSTQSNWKLAMPSEHKSDIVFTKNGKSAVFINKNDSLGIVTLGSSLIKYIPNVASFDVNAISGQWLSYELNDNDKSFVMIHLKTGEKKTFSGSMIHDFKNDDRVMLQKSVLKEKSGQTERVKWIDLISGKSHVIWEGKSTNGLLFDSKLKQVLFTVGNSIWFYKDGMDTAVCMVKKIDSIIDPELEMGYLRNFSKDGHQAFITLKTKAHTDIASHTVEVWTYRDAKLQTEQEQDLGAKEYYAALNISEGKIIRIQGENDHFSLPQFEESPDTIGFIRSRLAGGSNSESNWNSASEVVEYVVSIKSGRKQKMAAGVGSNLSPQGKYLVYFNSTSKNYFCYELSTGISRNISEGIRTSWINEDRDDFSQIGGERGVATWLREDKGVLVYDRYDIWMFDPLGRKKPVNLTNGYGVKNKIVFYLGLEHYSKRAISLDQHLILNAFNTVNKNNGFYAKNIAKVGDPHLLTMGPYIYQLISNSYVSDQFSYPLKAKNSGVYLLRRMGARESPNYFTTTDFRTFKKLTDLNPEKAYNWYTTELHTWKSLDGRTLQGILYKPENFDQNKKYPVIFHYYERKSDGLNAYLKPELSSGSIDIPTYVSNGYIVFCPNIYYTIGDPMQGTYDAVVSAAKYMSTLYFVNPSKMGIQGHSFGGIQTNYLVACTNLFKAACSASGLADLISGYGTLYGTVKDGYSNSMQHIYEIGQNRMGKSLWENTNIYIKNSAVLNIPKISTPILLMHTKMDRICPYSNIMEFFLGLRRMGKRAWMLAYPQGIHSVHGKEAEDFTVRMQQFFDHYLKDKPAPIWMLDGIAAKDRGIKTGFDLDTNGRSPNPGLLTVQEQKKVDSLITAKPMILKVK